MPKKTDITKARGGAGAVTTPIDPAQVALISQQVKDGILNEWFGPANPLAPVAPAGTEPRQRDYAVGENLQTSPRSQEPVSFKQLRELADGYDLLRIAIENRKDQFVKMPWGIKVKPQPGESPKAAEKRQLSDTRVQDLEAFFHRPDGHHTWQDWARMLLEEMLVVDAATLWVRRTLGGKVHSLHPLDGTTIKRVIDEHGFTPDPPLPAYQQVIKNVPAVNLTSSELIYRPRNIRAAKAYGYGNVEQIVVTVNIAMRRQVHQLQYYTAGNMPDAIISVPKHWTPKQILEFEERWNSLLEGNTGNRRKGRFVPTGETGKADITFTKAQELKDEMDEWLARIICWNLGLPVTALVKTMNRAASESQAESAKEEGLTPHLLWFRDMMNLILQDDQYMGQKDLTFEWGDAENEDLLEAAEIDDTYVRSGIKGVDEVRTKLGLEPIGVGNIIITPSGPVPLDAEALDMQREQARVGLEGSKKALEAPADGGGEQNGKNGTSTPAKPNNSKGKDGGEQNATKILKKKVLKASPATFTHLMKVQAGKLTGAIATKFRAAATKSAHAMVSEYAALTKGVEDDADQIMDALDLSDLLKLVDDMGPGLELVTQEGGANALAELELNSADLFDTVNQAAAAYARDRAAQLVGMRYNAAGELVANPSARWAITDSTREAIKRLVVSALTDGMTPAELGTAITDSTAFSEARAETIARTELAKAHVQGNIEGWRASELVTGKVWILGSEHDFEDECNDNAEEGEVALDDDFSSGDDGPPAHPNCVCDVVAVLGDSQESDE